MGFARVVKSKTITFKMQLMCARMWNRVLAVGILAAGSAGVAAQPTSAPPVGVGATNAVGPKIQFATPVYDFGRVKAGEPVKYTYVFTNTGDGLLIINGVQAGCSCATVGEWTKQVEPGETGSIAIQFNTDAYNGFVVKQPAVTCNVTNQPMVVLQIKGTVYRLIVLAPQIAVLNVMPDVDMASAVVTITNNTEEPLMLFAPESNNRMFSAELKTNTPGKGYQLTISTVPPLGLGSVSGQITVRTGWTNPPTISVPTVANVQPTFMVVPPHITLAPGPLGAAITNSVTIHNLGTNQVALSDPVVNAPGAEVQIKEMQAGKAFMALVAFPQGFAVPPGKLVEMSFKTSHPRFPVVKVPILQMPQPAAPPAAAAPPVKVTPPPVVPSARKPRPLTPRPPPPLPPTPPGR